MFSHAEGVHISSALTEGQSFEGFFKRTGKSFAKDLKCCFDSAYANPSFLPSAVNLNTHFADNQRVVHIAVSAVVAACEENAV